MKSWGEVHDKVNEYMDKLSALKRNSFEIGGGREADEMRGFIDALLWVLDQNGGLLK